MKYEQPTITAEEVKKIATLARIELTPEEVAKFQKELSSILDYVNQINEVDTSGVEFSSHTDQTNVFREDTPENSLSQKEATANREKTARDGYFIIKSVLDHK
jgi:aspartyl-tRNA(Asn)/glutamyl-tRNA(Gln) amidotransferase subunit C